MAGQSIGSASLKLVADATGLSTGLSKAKDTIAGWGKDIATTALGFLSADVAKGLFTGVVDSVKEAFESVDELSKAADRIGVTTEALAGLQHIADLSGVSTEQLEKNLSRLNRTFGEAGFAGTESAKALAKWGLDTLPLAQMPFIDALGVVTDKMESLTSASQKAALANDLFSKGGSTMVNMLAGGSKALREGTEEARLFGLTISQHAAKGIEAMNDAISRVKSVLTGVGRQLAIGIAPVIEKIAVSFTDWVKDMGGVQPAILKIGDAFVGVFGVVLDGAQKATHQLKDLAELAQQINNPSFKGLGVTLAKPALGLFTGGDGTKMGESWSKSISKGWEDVKKNIFGKSAPGTAGGFRLFEDLEGSGKAVKDEMKRVEQILDAARTPLQKFKDELKELDTFFAANAINAQEYGNAVSAAFDKIDTGKAAVVGKGAGAAMAFGSQEALSSVNRLMSSSTSASNNPAEILKKAMEQDRKHQRETIRKLEDIKRALGTEKVVGSFLGAN